MTQQEVDRLSEYYVDLLGLHDWEIHIAWQCRPDEMILPNCFGNSSCEESSKQALIYILDEQYYKGEPFKYDFEVILVHELLHLKTTLLTDKDEESIRYRVLHQLIDDMAKAIVSAKRHIETS